MTLAPGSRLTHYEILGPLGAGGMGEVWRARDTRLQREVAIKVLPEGLADDEERLRRFEREARTLASVNHPNIAGIHGVDQVGDTCFLALELVPGEDLATRLSRGALPVDEAIDVCRQIAEGLEAAHEAGVVHRDLKPANVRITPEGVVKLLDFGLAKPMRPEASRSGTKAATGEQSNSFLVTSEGMVLGTPTYMSPEQARGKPVDRRTDIWAFGCVLYECLTGKRAFGGESLTDVLAAIVECRPEWSAFPDATPARVRALVVRCLDKDPRARLRDIGEARIVLGDPAAGEAYAAPPSRTPYGRWAWPVVATGLALAWIGSIALRDGGPRSAAGRPRPLRLDVSLDEPLDRTGRVRRKIALSRDGRRLAYVAWESGNSVIRVRDLETGGTVNISEHDGAHSPFFSPDGQWVGFFTQGQLKKARADGSALIALCPAPGTTYGGAWSEDGTIVFSTDATGLTQISSEGGAPRPVAFTPTGDGGTRSREESASRPVVLWPHFLRGTRQLLLTATEGQGLVLVTVSLDTGESKRLVAGVDGRVVAGHLIFQLERTVFAAGFDSGKLELTIPPVALATKITVDNAGALTCGISDDGLLIYQLQGDEEENQLVWVDRSGASTPVTEERRSFGAPRLSPDGDRIAWGGRVSETQLGEVWVLDQRRGSISRVTFESALCGYPAWTADGQRVAYTSQHSGLYFLMYAKGIDEDLPPERLGTHDVTSLPCSFSPDGRSLLYYEVHAETQRDIFLWPIEGPEPIPLVATRHNERAPRFSRDGRWFAYVSDETGSDEIFVRPFPEAARRWKISIGGGREPAWNPVADELFYRSGESLLSVRYRISDDGTVFEPAPPVELFRRSCLLDSFGNANYDVDVDGSRFLMVEGVEPIPGRLQVVTSWFDEIEQALASGR